MTQTNKVLEPTIGNCIVPELRVFILGVLICFSSSQLATADDSKESRIAKGKELLGNFLLHVETIRDSSVLYSGVYHRLSGRPDDGAYPVVGFWAVDDGGDQQRFWQVSQKSAPISKQIGGFAVDRLKLSEEKDWIVVSGGSVIPFDEDKHPRTILASNPRFDPVVGVLSSPAGVMKGHTTVGRDAFKNIRQEYVIDSKKVLGGYEVKLAPPLFQGRGVWIHLFFEDSQGLNMTRYATTAYEEELTKDFTNATFISRARWTKGPEKIWFPEAGESVHFYGQTMEKHSRFMQFRYKCRWLERSEFPPKTFSKDSMSGIARVKLGSVSEMLERLDRLPELKAN